MINDGILRADLITPLRPIGLIARLNIQNAVVHYN